MDTTWVDSARPGMAPGRRWRLSAGFGGSLLMLATLLPWWRVGGGPGELPARGDAGISDPLGLAVFLAGAALLLLATVRYATEAPLAIDRPLAYRGLLAVAGCAFAARAIELAGQGALPLPPDRGPGFWVVPVGLAAVAVALLAMPRRADEPRADSTVEPDATNEPDATTRGRLDRLDIWIAAGLIVAVLAGRTYGLGQPTQMYFDEIYHARTATEFLQDWRYGIDHQVYEWTHPMLAKYAMAGGIALFSDDRVTASATLGVPVEDAVVQESIGSDAGATKDRLFVATGSAVRIYDLSTRGLLETLAIPGAAALSAPTPGGLVYVGTDGGAVYQIDATGLHRSAVDAGFPIAHVFAGAAPYVLVSDTAGDVVSIDTSAGSVVARATIPGVAAFASLAGQGQPAGGAAPMLVAYRDGVALIDARSLAIETSVRTDSPATSLAFDRESAQGTQTVYVAAGDSVALVSVTSGTAPTLALVSGQPSIEMPGVVTRLVFDEATKILHALGRSPNGSGWTVYAIEANGGAVFSDAPLPFEPVALGLDTPQAGHEELLAFAADGSTAAVDVGQFAFSWRIVGVLFGTLGAVCLYLLARMLFKRRSVGLLVGFFSLADGMMFAQSRIATNDVYVGGLLLLAYVIFAALWLPVTRKRWAFWLGMPALGLVLGLALASKWVAVYAIASMVVLVLIRSALGRVVTVLGLAVATGVLGWLAIASTPGAPNLTFALIMLAVTVVAAAASARQPAPEGWLRPSWGAAVRAAWTAVCLAAVPIVVYVALYIPWAMPWQSESTSSIGPLPAIACWHVDSSTGVCDNAWPSGHTGQTLWDLTVQMYDYHNNLRSPHPAASPWWAWPLDLKPVWFESGSAPGDLTTSIHDGGNVVLWWLAIPAMAFAAWQAYRRRSLGAGLVAVAFLWLWLGWARIDRATFEYHFYAALPFFLLGLACFLSELWHGPSPRTWLLARISLAGVLLLPALLWLLRPALCGLAGVDSANYFGAAVCGPGWGTGAAGLPSFLVPALAVAGIAGAWLAATARNPRRFVAAVCGLAALCFAFDYPDLAAIPIPNSIGPAFAALSPTWQYGFQFSTNLQASSRVQLIGPGSVGLMALALVVAAAAAWLARRSRAL